MDTQIWVITHKKYNEITDNMYKTLHVGRALSQDLGYQGDDTKDNISNKNKSYCELTGLYWLWKNYKCDIIGICHYRRFFLEKERFLTKTYIEDTLKKYDIIVPECTMVVEGKSLKEQYCVKHCKEDWEICRQVISERCPEYLNAFDIMQESRLINICNMLIAKKEIYDEYCEWLFDILFEVEKRINMDNKDDYQKRVIGFLSERLLKVWLIAKDYKVKEQPVKLMESNEIERYFHGKELKRQLFDKLTLSLVKKYKDNQKPVLAETPYSLKLQQQSGVESKVPIWMCWWQGEENAPDMVKKCIDSVRKNIDNDICELHIITLANCQEYVTLSNQIIEKFNSGNITMTTLSDRLRMELLYRYGGLWIEATYFIADNRINDVIKTKGFFTQKLKNALWDDDERKGRWAGNFIKGNAGFELFGFVMEAFDEYYNYMDRLIEYFMIDYFIEIAYDNLENVKAAIQSCVANNEQVMFLDKNANKLFNQEVWDNILKDNWLFKMNYKKDYRKSNVIGETTYYGKVIGELI